MFSDIIMPKMNGYLLVEKAQKLYPELKIILASGFQGNQSDSNIKLDEPIIAKPYENICLLRRIRTCLDKQDAKTIQDSHQKNHLSTARKSIVWTSDMSIDGGGELDEDHKLMFSLLNRCQEVLELQDNHHSIQTIITEVVQYTHDHFASEELLMHNINYPYAKNHCDVHRMITKQLSQKILVCSDKEVLKWLITDMSTWLVEHIMEMDKPLHKYILKHKEQVDSGLKGNTEDKMYDE